MWKLGLWPRNSFFGNICFEFSVLFPCSVYVGWRCALLMVPDCRMSAIGVGCSLSVSTVLSILVVGITRGLRCENFTNTVLMHVHNIWVFCIAHYCIVLVYEPWRVHRLWYCSHKNSKCYFSSIFSKRLRDFYQTIFLQYSTKEASE
jgi:hypothetical protein